MDDTIRRALTGAADRPALTFRRTYRASPGQVRDACTNPERLARWLGQVEGGPGAPGEAFTATLSEDPDDTASGRVRSCSSEGFSVTWAWQGEAESTISVRIAALDEQTTELTLDHRLAEPDHAAGYGGGWEQCLHALARALGGPATTAGDDEAVEAAAVGQWRTIARAPLELTQRLDAPPERVWAAFATADGLRSWWWRHWDDVSVEVDARIGGGYRIEAPGAGITLHGTYLALEAPGHLAFTWEWEDGENSVPDEAVDVRIMPDGAGSLVRVRHSGPWADDAPADSYRQGWEFTLGQLRESLGA
ncbi:hypothetical protein EXU48_16100 [Occultella glacieicola]|uniref:Activator of Hsp90 ATPase homologue 1/2-like C-terminal domain-containing protein n=1 Tax=Occultella glacieicola TaxID=2518684 RepID=A0ABY2E381_9MICO|nr:SRPBCC family protein [Occultella glacieicola]TDE91654.1 hypothetical protein EXU48_16100 [Occultella glacieicola]